MARIGTHLRKILVGLCLTLLWAVPTHAQEIWVPPTYQADTGGLGIGSNTFWPVTPAGAVRLAFAVPNNLLTFSGAKLVLIPSSPAAGSSLIVYVCAAKQSDLVGASCSGAFTFPFSSPANRLHEVDITTAVGPSVGLPGQNYLAVVAFSTPTTATDHILGMRFSYGATGGPTGRDGCDRCDGCDWRDGCDRCRRVRPAPPVRRVRRATRARRVPLARRVRRARRVRPAQRGERARRVRLVRPGRHGRDGCDRCDGRRTGATGATGRDG